MPKAKKKLVVEDLPGDEAETAKVKGGDGTIAGATKIQQPAIAPNLPKTAVTPKIAALPPTMKGPVSP